MAIFRVEKNQGYTVMSNYHLRDKKLSYKAKGLLSFMISLPEDWDYSVNGLVAVSKESIKSIRSGLKELEDNFYLKRERIQKKDGRFDYEYYVYEQPYNHFGYAVKGYADNGLQINTNIINTNNKDKIDKNKIENFVSKHNPLTLKLINKNYVSRFSEYLNDYDDLFNELLEEYTYKDINIILHYILNNINFNNYTDECGNKIENRFGYLKNAIYSNIEQFNKYGI